MNQIIKLGKSEILLKLNKINCMKFRLITNHRENIKIKNVGDWDSAIPYNKIPGPTIIGSMIAFMPGGKYSNLKFSHLHTKLREEYGDIIKIPGLFGRKDFIWIYDPEDFGIVFRTAGQFPVRNIIESLAYYRKTYRRDVFKGNSGLITENGSKWYEIRSIANPVLMQPRTVKMYVPQIDIIAKEFLEIVKNQRNELNETSGEFRNHINKWALESVGVIALDTRLGVLTDRDQDDDTKNLITYVRDFFTLSYQIDLLPSIWKYYKTPTFKKLMKTFDGITDQILNYIEIGKKHLTEQSKLKTINNREESVFAKLLKHDKHVALVMAIDMIFGGIDTTGSASINVLYQLAKNPEKQAILRKEIMKILPEKDSPLTAESMLNLPYLRACIKETLRVLPIASANTRETGRNLVIKGYQVPKGKNVLFGSLILQNDEKIFPQPDKFIPERWLKNRENLPIGCPNAKTANPYVYLPFGYGVRACVGKRFAELEIEILVARFVRNFNIEWHYEDLKYSELFVNVPIGDCKFRLNDLEM